MSTPATTSPAASTTGGAAASREYGLDWLRVFAFGLLILYHSGMAFVSWDWHVKDVARSHALAPTSWSSRSSACRCWPRCADREVSGRSRR